MHKLYDIYGNSIIYNNDGTMNNTQVFSSNGVQLFFDNNHNPIDVNFHPIALSIDLSNNYIVYD